MLPPRSTEEAKWLFRYISLFSFFYCYYFINIKIEAFDFSIFYFAFYGRIFHYDDKNSV